MSKTAYLKCRVSDPFKRLFQRAAQAHGFDSESALLVQLAEYAVQQVGELPEEQPKEVETRGRWVGVRITDREAKALAKIVERENFKNPSELLLSMIRQRLTKQPHLNGAEVDQLEEAKFQLQAIGRNLNQMVRAINDGKADSARFSERYATEILERINAVKREINRLVEQSTARNL